MPSDRNGAGVSRDERREADNPLGKGVPQEWTGDPCPVCPAGELVKPRSEKRQCPNCRHVEDGQYAGHELRDFNLTYRQGRRLLLLFGYEGYGTPGTIGTRLRAFCNDHDIAITELNDLLADLREQDGYDLPESHHD